jgi:outer membrane protein OmpA-like peptidoglycan-associated protein
MGGNAAKLSLLNTLLDTMPFGDVDTPGELANLIDIVNRIIATSMGELVVPGLAVSDFEALGIPGVTDSPNGGNLSVIVAAVAGSGANGTNVDTATELRAVVAAAVDEFNISPTLKAIIDYANSNLNPLPTVIDYNQAGVGLVDAETLDAVNAIVDSLLGADVSSADKVGTLVYNLFVALGRIVAYVASPTVETPPSINDYRAAGLVAIDANSVSAMNAVIAGLTASEVDSTSELAALLQKIRDDAAAEAAARAAAAAAAAAEAERLARENAGQPYVPPVYVPPVTTPVTPGTISKVQLTTSPSGTLVLKWTGAPTVTVKVISSAGKTQEFEANQQRTGQIIDSLEPGRAYAIILAPVGNNDPNAAQSVAYAVPALTPTSTEATQLNLNKVEINWKQQGFAKLYKIVVTPNKGAAQTFTTGETKLALNLLGGRKYEATITAVGEGDGASEPAVVNINPAGAVTSVVATPFAKKKQTLVSWKPFEVKPGAKYVVRVDGKQACLGSLTSCVVPRVLTAKNEVVVSVVGGSATAVDIDDRKLVYQAEVTFVPNTKILSPGATAVIKANAAQLKKARFTKVVVTGHANPVDGIPIKISDKLANERALVIALQLKKLLPGVKIVAVGRSVFSPAKPGAASSLGNIRAEIYGTK